MISAIVRALRMRHWVKNFLIFIPTLAAHEAPSTSIAIKLIEAFVALSFVASTFYLINDIVDVESDRQHPVKRTRPIAAGELSIGVARIFAAILLAFALLLGSAVGVDFLKWLFVYGITTFCYSMFIKRVVLMDCFVLAALYSLRVVAGGSVTNIAPSFWLLATSGFLFLSLAFGKRFAEIAVSQSEGRDHLPGRDYRVSDAPVILTIGVSSAFMAVLVLALYVNSDVVTVLYKTPLAIWGAVPVLLLWVSSLWFRLWRGEVSDDPVLFALRDRVSLICGAAMLLIVSVGAEGWLS